MRSERCTAPIIPIHPHQIAESEEEYTTEINKLETDKNNVEEKNSNWGKATIDME